MWESPLAHFFYLNFRKELSILVEADFSHLIHFLCFLLCSIKSCACQNFTNSQSLWYAFNLNQNWRKTNIRPCRDKIGLSVMQKWIFHDFSIKSSKFLTANLQYCAKIEINLFRFKVPDNTLNLIPYLLKSNK